MLGQAPVHFCLLFYLFIFLHFSALPLCLLSWNPTIPCEKIDRKWVFVVRIACSLCKQTFNFCPVRVHTDRSLITTLVFFEWTKCILSRCVPVPMDAGCVHWAFQSQSEAHHVVTGSCIYCSPLLYFLVETKLKQYVYVCVFGTVAALSVF